MADGGFALLRLTVEVRLGRIGYGAFNEAAEVYRSRPACPITA